MWWSAISRRTLILLGARFIFHVPMIGSLGLLVGATGLFIAANLALGFTFSTIAKNQLQAMQMTVFFLLPSILLSGFMFPFRGMPNWAQWIGEALPNTHFLRIVRGILLKGNNFSEIWPNIWPLLIFLFVVGSHRIAALPPDARLAGVRTRVPVFCWIKLQYQHLRRWNAGLAGSGSHVAFPPLIGRATIPKGGAL